MQSALAVHRLLDTKYFLKRLFGQLQNRNTSNLKIADRFRAAEKVVGRIFLRKEFETRRQGCRKVYLVPLMQHSGSHSLIFVNS